MKKFLASLILVLSLAAFAMSALASEIEDTANVNDIRNNYQCLWCHQEFNSQFVLDEHKTVCPDAPLMTPLSLKN